MKELQFPFTKSGWTHELVKREGPMVLVGRHKKGRQKHWEVVVVRVMKPDKFTPTPYEKYPANEDWGTYGFTCRTLQQAEKRFARLESKFSPS